MHVLLTGAAVNAILDPIFIFYFAWGIEGAAWASVASRCVIFAYAGRALLLVHRLPGLRQRRRLRRRRYGFDSCSACQNLAVCGKPEPGVYGK